jgi:nucleotide-binding universal stress UspA family protein
MFNTIVVGVDGREGGRDALALAERLKSVFGGELIAVHAYQFDSFHSRAIGPDFQRALHENATALVQEEIRRAGLAAFAVAMPDGSPGRALHAAAKWHDSGLIVVGSAHRGPLGRVLAGDVTAGALHGASCPVVVAPRRFAERPADIRKIGVGYDGSPESHAAVERARDLAAAGGGQLRVIRVLLPPMPGGAGLAYDRDWHDDADIVRERAQADVDEVVAQLGEIATGEVVVGDPVAELSYAANDLDLLVTGSRNYGPVRRVMLGSTSSKLVQQAPCPVLVITRGAVEDAAEGADAAAVRAQP